MATRLTAIDPAATTGKTKALLDAVQGKLGMTPNLFRTFANSTAVLDGYLSFSGALSGGALDAKLRERIALTVAEANECDYCLSAHTAIGAMVGLSAADIDASRRSTSADPKVEAALRFARQIVTSGGDVSAADVDRVRSAGFTDGEIAEVVANVALNIFTNYFNHVAGTEVDFPLVSAASTTTAL